MSIFKILFSFSGRIPRLTYWVANFGIQATLFLVDFIAGPIRGTIGPGHASYASLAATVATATLVASTYLCAFWCTLAVAVKRWHDRGKSGLWMFIGLIPFIGPFWYFLELAFLEGTPGPNEFDEGISRAMSPSPMTIRCSPCLRSQGASAPTASRRSSPSSAPSCARRARSRCTALAAESTWQAHTRSPSALPIRVD